MATFTALFDACVLYPAALRDLLLELALCDLFRGRWTERINDEWIGALLEKRPDLQPTDLERTRQLMNENVRDAVVTGFEPLIDGLELPDRSDRHVLAAAIRTRAHVIVTYNLTHFPQETLASLGIEPQHPDEFLVHLLDLSTGAVVGAAQRVRARLRKPVVGPQAYLDSLVKLALPESVARLREFENVI